MKIVRGLVGSLAGSSMLVLLTASSVAAQDQVEWSEALDAGQRVKVEGISGDVEIFHVNGPEVVLQAHKTGRERDFDQVKIVIEETRRGVTICAVYRNPDADDCSGKWDNHRDRDRGRRSIDVSVDFEIGVPAGIDVDVDLVSGDIDGRELESDVYANTVSGEIRLETSGIAEAQTVSGEIDVTVGTANLPELSFQTVSGDITLTLPGDVNADVEFSSMTGDLDTDFPLTIMSKSGGWVGSEIEGQLGDGGPTLVLETVSGDVEIRRLR